MKLINTDGLAFIGPGSEWFWTAVSGLVLAVTFVAIYRQLRLQRAAAAIEQSDRLTREWNSERMLRAMLPVLLAIPAGAEPTDLPAAASEIADFWERVGYLTRTGHVNRDLVSLRSAQIQLWWAVLRPTAQAQRERAGRDLWGDFEWLATTMAALDATHGITRDFGAERLARNLAGAIASVRQAIETEEALRSVRITPPMEVDRAPAAPEPAP
jgi:hypothetical protein